jgi:cell wall-associated NlpC family hydrolase
MYSTPYNTLAYIKTPPTVANFIGVPFESGGRDPATGLDCWGLIIAAARECFGLVLPDYRGYNDADEFEQTAHLFDARDDWVQVSKFCEQPGDVVVLRIGAPQPQHAGLVVADGLMLHTLVGRNACVEKYRGRAWSNRVEGFYTWSPR